MITSFINGFTGAVLSRCESFVRLKQWKLILSLLLPLSVLFFSFPSYERIGTEYQEYWQAVNEKSSSPFAVKEYAPESHEAKLTFRMTVPLLACVLSLKTTGILLLQGVFGFLLFLVSVYLFEKITEDPVAALLLTLSLSFIWAGRCAFVELRGIFDAVALFFLIFSMCFRNPLLVFAGVFLAAWTDERGLIASSLVLLYWWISAGFTLRKAFTPQSISVIFAWVAYFLTRYALIHVFHFKTVVGNNLGISCFISQMSNLPGGVWTALEGNWVLVCIALFLLIRKKDFLQAFAFSLSMVLLVVVAMAVIDITRSMAYLLPAMFIAVLVIRKKGTETPLFLRNAVLLSTVVSFLYPAYYVNGPFQTLWTYPFPLYILRHLFGTGIHS